VDSSRRVSSRSGMWKGRILASRLEWGEEP
jgi:hypothetical protein